VSPAELSQCKRRLCRSIQSGTHRSYIHRWRMFCASRPTFVPDKYELAETGRYLNDIAGISYEQMTSAQLAVIGRDFLAKYVFKR